MKRLSESHKQNLSKAMKGKKASMKTRVKMSEKKREYWNRIRDEQERINGW